MPSADIRNRRSFLDVSGTPGSFFGADRTAEATWFVAIFIFALFAAGFLVRVWGISKFHYWDEWVYLQDAQVICCGKINYSELDFRPPLLSVIFAGVFLFWRSVYVACITTAILNALAPVFLYFAGTKSVGRIPAAIASVLLAFAPFFVGVFPDGFASDDTGNSLLTDSPSLTMLILGLWLLLRALERPTALRFFCAGISLALCILMRFGAIPSVAMLLLLPLISPSRWKALLASVGGVAAGLAPYLLWSRLNFGGFLSTLRSAWSHVEGPVEPRTYFLHNAATVFTPVAIAGLLLCLVYQLSLLRERFVRGSGVLRSVTDSRQSAIRVFLWLWLAAGLLFFSLMPHKEPRYILPLAPPVLLLAGSGLALFAALPSRALRVTGAMCVAAALLLVFLPLRERFRTPFINLGISDEELASRLLQSSVPAGASLWMSFNYPVFAFYTNLPIQELSDVGPALYEDMKKVPPGDVLIVYREAENPSQSDIAWVDASGRFKRIVEYPSLVIYCSVGSPKQGAR
ncbi:glycosyltransferase family 39 protein [Occallatibacter riparius]|uniref:Glycosyltransferase family 39 protein n=1 Tax=Occallatibacter riparius TaxID=1002689 RepID=A0A9J7BX12_9BACT|nr:glycosyltransferase family 39 protein [Occallatibacter riparius]UWZ85438.1 glycosyltransferase family 39 protein [Occallatibacter riparius]